MQTFQEFTLNRRPTMSVVLTIAVFGVVRWELTARETQAQLPSPSSARGQTTGRSFPQEGKPSHAIIIRVVDPEGKPLKGVKIFRNHVYQPDGEERPRIENKEFRTDSAGTAVVSLSGTSVDLRIWATKKDFVPLHAMWAKRFQSDGDQIPDEFTFQLQQGTKIGGIVTDENGEPIEGVKVEVENRTAESPSRSPSEPGRRPVNSRWLAEGKDLLTDKHGRWELGNVPPDKSLGGDDGLGSPNLTPTILLRFSHPDYVDDAEWGSLQREQYVTLESLRNQTATIVMKRDARSEPN